MAALSERDLESAKAMMERIVPANVAERQVRDELELLVYNQLLEIIKSVLQGVVVALVEVKLLCDHKKLWSCA